MTTIRATCPNCGEVGLLPRELTLTLATADDYARYSFDCPKCREPVSRYADPDVVAKLMGVGVVVRPATPAALTYCDLARLKQALLLADDLSDVAAEEMSG